MRTFLVDVLYVRAMKYRQELQLLLTSIVPHNEAQNIALTYFYPRK